MGQEPYIANHGVQDFRPNFKTELITYAESKEGQSCFMARSLLFNEGMYFDPITDVPPHDPQARQGAIAEDKTMTIIPNPADASVTFDVETFKGGGISEVFIDIFHELGRRVARLVSTGEATTMVWQTNHVSEGVYLCHLSIDGTTKSVDRLVIVH